MRTILHVVFLMAQFVTPSCKKTKTPTATITPPIITPLTVKAADLSEWPEISTYNLNFKNQQGVVEDVLTTLKNAGVNTIRLKLWHTPATAYNGLSSVKSFANSLKQKGFKIWLTVHYSNTWADPGQQITPIAWQGLPLNTLKDSVTEYTKLVMQQIQPEYIQIGNEINSGLLHPQGSSTNIPQMLTLLKAASAAVRQQSSSAKIIVHYAGTQGAASFYANLTTLDYDIIGISFYPIWHYQTIDALATNLSSLATTFSKQVLIAETAYPFTLNWSDNTHNIVGQPNQLLPQYSATPFGQAAFLTAIRNVNLPNNAYLGFCYWGATIVAYKGATATDGSPWENQTLWDFDLKAVKALDVFKD